MQPDANQIIEQPPVQYQALAFLRLPQDIRLDQWYQPSPIPPRPRYNNEAVFTSPVLVPPPSYGWHQRGLDPERAPRRQYDNLTQTLFTPAPIEVVTVDKWLQAYPMPRRRVRPRYSIEVAPVAIRVTTDWLHGYSIIPPPYPRHTHVTPVLVRTVVPEVITPDKWLTDSPPHYPTVPIQHVSYAFLDIFPEPEPEPPIPPEPPEPVELRKAMVVRVRHTNRPPGGFNTIFYVDDEER